MKRTLNWIFGAALALSCASALAAGHAPSVGAHGGPQTAAGPFHVELVVHDAAVAVFLNSHGSQPIATTGFQGVADFSAKDGKSVHVTLEPSGDNRLSGAAPAPVPADGEVTVKITTAAGGVEVARFGGSSVHHE
jgi:nitrogen fixation protein FixH